MAQYNSIKAKHPDALLLFRVGDFYETFGQDAIRAAGILGIVLTKRANGAASSVELAGFPHHSLDSYLPKLVRAGERVAICEQLEDPKATKTIVKRGVTELVSPGIVLNENILENKQNNFLACIYIEDDNSGGIALMDISTGEFLCSEGQKENLLTLLNNFKPSELILTRETAKNLPSSISDQFHCTWIDHWVTATDYTTEILLNLYRTSSLKGFGIEGMSCAVIASGSLVHFLRENQQHRLDHIKNLKRIDQSDFVWLDQFTLRNLEILESPHPNATTLIDVLDETLTPAGSRMIRNWITMPLTSIDKIHYRQSVTGHLKASPELNTSIRDVLSEIGDLERIMSRISTGRSNPREMIQLARNLMSVEKIFRLIDDQDNVPLSDLHKKIDPCNELESLLSSALEDEPPVVVSKGNVIRKGYSIQLDELRSIMKDGKEFMVKLQQEEIKRTGINSLKLGYNNVFGYYIEVTNTHKHKVPDNWIRKQTLVNSERYITPELKEYEEKILGAEEKIQQIEERLFSEIMEKAAEFSKRVYDTTAALAALDCLSSFAYTASRRNYTLPEVNESLTLDIKGGRHPVLEQQLPAGELYIPNDLTLENNSAQMIIITGPNMSGKSALLRQTALIALMAQTGSYVPADSATIGIVDKVFTRVGASDNISSGESTFMVEMNETASILNNLSERSLVILDEIGRGTATYDGISIAWAIAEYLHENTVANPKTLFATHYHELTELEDSFTRISNAHISVKETDKDILFLRKLAPGGSEHSFGIHVARMAGMPDGVVKKASQILEKLERSARGSAPASGKDQLKLITEKEDALQLSIFQLDDPILEQLRDDILDLEIDNLTPVEALMKLHGIKQLLEKSRSKKDQKLVN
jgi:DNA mismatch repair protein MutS